MKRVLAVWMCGWLLVCVTNVGAATDATSERAIRKTAEAGMLVTGTIEVNPDGSLHHYSLDKPEKLPPVVVDVVSKTVSSWIFKLSAPTNAVVTTEVSLRVIAKPLGDGNFKVAVHGASFGQPGTRSDEISYKDHSYLPRYPQGAINARVGGTVYVLVRIGRDGTTQEAIAEQVNLDSYGTEAEMNHYRKLLSDSALVAARHWTYNQPKTGPDVDDPYWTVRIPVNFSLIGFWAPPAKQYGQWETYVPGPRQTPPWSGKALANESPDAVSGNELQTGDPRLQLVTPVGST